MSNPASTITMTDQEFIATFKPIKNHINSSASYDGCLFTFSGHEFDYVKSIYNQSPLRVWTVSNDWSIVDGMAVVNRLGYLITEQAADLNTTYCVQDEEESFDADAGDESDATTNVEKNLVVACVYALNEIVNTRLNCDMPIPEIKDTYGLAYELQGALLEFAMTQKPTSSAAGNRIEDRYRLADLQEVTLPSRLVASLYEAFNCIPNRQFSEHQGLCSTYQLATHLGPL